MWRILDFLLYIIFFVGTYSKECVLSPALAAVMGVEKVVQMYWRYLIVLGRCSHTSVLSLAGSLPINDR